MEELYKSPLQLVDRFVTLSLLPDYRWKNLARQDLIRERNKPKEALKLPEKAPFFLPTTGGLEPKFDLTKLTDLTSADSAKKKDLPRFATSSVFLDALLEVKNLPEDYLKPIQVLSSLTIAKIESDIRRLSPDIDGSVLLIKSFVDCLSAAVDDGKCHELTQSYLELFLKLNAYSLAENRIDEELVEKIMLLKQKIGFSVKRVEKLLDQSLSVVLFLKHVAF